MNINVGWFIAAFAAYFIINIVVSLRVSKGTSGISGFALGQVGPVVLAFSFFATRLSASVYLGEPGIMWTSGWPYSWIGILNAAFWTATIIIVARRMRTYSHEDALQKVGPGNGFEAADIDQNDGEQRERHNDNGFIHAEEGGEQGNGALVLGNDEQNVEDGAADAGPDAQEVAIVPLAQEIRDGESAQGTGIGAHAA